MSVEYSEIYGVSAKKRSVAAGTAKNSKGMFPNAFCKIEKFIHRFQNPVFTHHGDGSGTKAILAYAYAKETGDMSVLREVMKDSVFMNTEDVFATGAIGGFISLCSTINRNTFYLNDEMANEFYEGDRIVRQQLLSFGLDVYGEVGETADLPNSSRNVLLDHSLFSMFEEKDVIDNGNIDVGHYVVAVASSGQAKWETEYNGGGRANGYTRSQHRMFGGDYRTKYPETFDPKIFDNAYTGSKLFTDMVTVETGEKITAGKLMLGATRTYAPIMMDIYKGIGNDKISGVVHISGGAWTKVLKYLSKTMNVVCENLAKFPTPILFKMIQEEANSKWSCMYEDFNMGVGYMIYVPDYQVAKQIVNLSNSYNVTADIIGRVEKARSGQEKSMIHIASEHGKFDLVH